MKTFQSALPCLVLALSLYTVLPLMGCSPVSSDLQTKAKARPQSQTLTETLTAQAEQPKVNILFVVDNSGSMKPYQETLSKNIDQFTQVFFKNKRIDYKIGVVPVYDSKYLNDQTVYKSGKRKMNALGELTQLQGRDDLSGQLYITPQTPEPEKVLKATVLLGTQWGPEAEESYTPVLAVMNEDINRSKNNHFYDPKAHLVIIFLTDADDVSPGLSAEDFYSQLVQSKNGDSSKIFIAAALPSLDNNSSSCQKDGRGPIQSFPSLMAVSGGQISDLCGPDFGRSLAKFAQTVNEKLSRQKIKLPFVPDLSRLIVSYGEANSKITERQVIPRGQGGYFYNANQNELLIDENLILNSNEGQFFIEATPLDPDLTNSGRIQSL